MLAGLIWTGNIGSMTNNLVGGVRKNMEKEERKDLLDLKGLYRIKLHHRSLAIEINPKAGQRRLQWGRARQAGTLSVERSLLKKPGGKGKKTEKYHWKVFRTSRTTASKKVKGESEKEVPRAASLPSKNFPCLICIRHVWVCVSESRKEDSGGRSRRAVPPEVPP